MDNEKLLSEEKLILHYYRNGKYVDFLAQTSSVDSWKLLAFREDCIRKGLGCEPNLEEANRILKQIHPKVLELSNSGDAYAQNFLGIWHSRQSYSSLIEYNAFKAFELFSASANMGFAPAQTNLAAAYRTGKGVCQNEEKALELFRAAAAQNYGPAFEWLGWMAAHGSEKDYAVALEMYNKSISTGSPDAICSLAFLYLNGYGVVKDVRRAYALYHKAAEIGIAQAQFQLYLLLNEGNGCSKNQQEALRWLRAAAIRGNADAQCELGYLHDKGEGVEHDEQIAAEWYLKAAEAGNNSARCNLAWCYAEGAGVRKDL